MNRIGVPASKVTLLSVGSSEIFIEITLCFYGSDFAFITHWLIQIHALAHLLKMMHTSTPALLLNLLPRVLRLRPKPVGAQVHGKVTQAWIIGVK